MRKIKTFMDYMLYKDWEGDHVSNVVSPIYNKIIYPVANNPLDDKLLTWKIKTKMRFFDKCSEDGKYDFVRKGD